MSCSYHLCLYLFFFIFFECTTFHFLFHDVVENREYLEALYNGVLTATRAGLRR